MEHPTLTCCYFPTTVVFIDDHESFVDTITSTLSLDFIYTPFVKVSAFNAFFTKHPSQLQQGNWTQSNDDIPYEPDYTHHDISVNFHLLHEQIYNKDRYKEISVAVVDYAMPECNGIELCQVIKKSNPNIQTLLLTGEADHQIAVDAFNKKLIDKFILKEKGRKFTANLDNTIYELAQDYFAKTFASLGMNVAANNPILKEPAFLELFKTTYNKHQACEYYLIDPSGGYLMLNSHGDATWLIVKNEEDFQVCCELANSEENLDANTLKLIKKKERIPFYHGEYLNIPTAGCWDDHLIKAEILTINKVQYPYAIYSGFQHTIIDAKKVHAFDEMKAAKNL
jgi:CheY-like chemotaxis protein